MPDPSAFDRATSLRRLEDEQFDVLVVGGGITGAGVALDAASRGLRTALVEREDFASGTSSKSSKMIHGGLRYLQQREFRLVYESLHERQRLIDNAPHLVAPLPFLIPLFGRNGVVSKQVARAYSTALWMYDATGGVRIGKRHKRVSKREVLDHFPTMRTDALVAGFLYYDARADDARLTLTVLRTAAVEFGAVVANYAPVTALTHDASGMVAGAVVEPRLTVPGADAERSFEVRARHVVNATGVWVDDLRALDEGTHPHSTRPAKGIHVTVPRSRLPADIAAVIPVAKDRRSIFCVPWPDGDDVYLGTTDTDWDGPLDDPACLPEDVDYVLDAANSVTSSRLERSDVTGVWAGVRPLLARTDGRHVSERTADMSRRHTVRVGSSGLVTVTGGKLTTYRRMAEDTVDALLRQGRVSTTARCRTRRLPLLGAGGSAELLRTGAGTAFGVDDAVLAYLVGRHGHHARDVLAMAGGEPDLLAPLVAGLPYLAVEAKWAVTHEMAVTLDDVLARRTRARLRQARAMAQAVAGIGSALAPLLGRDAAAVAEESTALAAAARRDLDRAGLEAGERSGATGQGTP
ncbi:MAG: glycerol-3-phosphate dehydrogenase/oxidase [Acidimicrobiales bacterium]